MKWDKLYPKEVFLRNENARVEIADVGCGFGGLLVALAQVYPDTLLLGKQLSYRTSY